jgi:hypothetical protein
MVTTNKEYLQASLDGLNLSDNDINVILMKAGLNADDPADVSRCDLAVYNRFSVVIKAASQNVSEGGYSLSWNIDAVKLYYNALCTELGKENVLSAQPKVRNRSNFW